MNNTLSYARLVGRSCIFNSDVHAAYKLWREHAMKRFNTCRCIMNADGVIKFTTSNRPKDHQIYFDIEQSFAFDSDLQNLIGEIPNTKQIRLTPHNVNFSDLQLLIERFSNFKKNKTTTNVFALIEFWISKNLNEFRIKILPNYRIEGTKQDFFSDPGVRGIVLHYMTAKSTEFKINKTLFDRSYIRPSGIKKGASAKVQPELEILLLKDLSANDFLNTIRPEISDNAYDLLQKWLAERNIT